MVVLAVFQCAFGQAQGLYHYDEFGNRKTIHVVGMDSNGHEQVTFGEAHQFGHGKPVEQATQTLTNQFVVRANAGTDMGRLANTWGVNVVGQMNWDSNLYIMEGTSTLQALHAANGAFERGEVAQVFTQFARPVATRQIPNDPNFSSQWHLRNTTNGHDINVEPLWNFTNSTHLGTGIRVGIVDGRVWAGHEDLAGNFNSGMSLWMAGGADSHGTAVAGLVAAVGNNGTGVTGVAPRSTIVGISLLNQAGTDVNEANALSHHYNTMSGGSFDGIHIYNNSWGPFDNATRTAAGPLARDAIMNGAKNGRGGLGNIYVWAGGNGGDADNVNYDGYANSRYTIAVAATTSGGVRASYSERGEALLVNAMGNGGLGVSTTTTGGSGYTSSFGGTSAASPMVAGVVALMLEQNPNLGWRDVQHILVNTSRRTDPAHSSWVENGSGRSHSEYYGFGTIDASAAVNAATSWVNVGEELVGSGVRTVDQAIPNNSPSAGNYGTAIFSEIDISARLVVETVEVLLTTTGSYGGDLEVVLISPFGTESTLARFHNDNASYDNWMFSTVKNWGESSDGTWTLRIRDGHPLDSNHWLSWGINVYGTAAIPEPASGIVWLGILVMASARRKRA